MAKKYLLYIHNKKFNQELKKSALINDLLTVHYGKKIEPQPRQLPSDNINVVNMTYDLPTPKKPVTQPQIKPDIIKEEKYKFCKHDAMIGLCKFGCTL